MTTRLALVTGGTRGIGLGIAHALADDGWDLVLCGVRPAAEVAGVVSELKTPPSPPATSVPAGHLRPRQERTGAVHYIAADLSRLDDRRRLVEDIRRQFGAINALVNNAGRAPRTRADLLDASEDSFDEVLRTNLQGPYFLTQAIARDQIARRRTDPGFLASIVFITSVSAELASVNRGEYCVSKAGASMAAKLFAARLAPERIPVYEVRPGIIATDMTAGVKDAYDRRIADGLIPEGRWGQPHDVGRIVAALVRGDLPYATGAVITADGGLTIPRL